MDAETKKKQRKPRKDKGTHRTDNVIPKGGCFTRGGQRVCPSVMPKNKPKCNDNSKSCVSRIRRYKKALAEDRANYKHKPKSEWGKVGRPKLKESEKVPRKLPKELDDLTKKWKAEAKKRYGFMPPSRAERKIQEEVAEKRKKWKAQNKDKLPPKRKKKIIKKKMGKTTTTKKKTVEVQVKQAPKGGKILLDWD